MTALLASGPLRALILPIRNVHAWLAGEIEAARRLRRYLMEEGPPRDRIRTSGYWRTGELGAHARVYDDALSAQRGVSPPGQAAG